MGNKKITFLIKVMSGGGAERVISLLSDAMIKQGYDVSLIVTHQTKAEAQLDQINANVGVISLPDEIENYFVSNLPAKIRMLWARFIDKCSRVFLNKYSKKASIVKYHARNYKEVCWLKAYFKANENSVAVAFLYDSIFLSLLSKTNKNRLIISERGDPCQSFGSKTTMAFLKNEFKKADGVVFQSPDVARWYEENTGVKGTVIFNPVKPDLPELYNGEREKKIVNFCRISKQKNIPLLLDAFEKFQKDFPQYELYIYGGAANDEEESCLTLVKDKINDLSCKEKVHLLPARADIHEVISNSAMFVSSSDFEGMSNSMLEAMALGLPCVCTDCPAGGAAAVIENGVNGLLVPVGDSKKMYEAMKKIAENQDFADKLSKNAAKLRENQSVDKIIRKWMEIING